MGWSTRSREHQDKIAHESHSTSTMSQINPMDADGVRGFFHKGEWFYQKFHYRKEMESLCRKFHSTKPNFMEFGSIVSIVSEKEVELPEEFCKQAIFREFDIEWPNGRRVNRGQAAVDAWVKARRITLEK